MHRLLLEPGGHQKRESRAMADARFYPDSSTMHLDNALYDGQAQSSASLRLGDRVIHLLELV
jgi:hypothetical protein